MRHAIVIAFALAAPLAAAPCAAAQDYVAPKRGAVLQFSLTRAGATAERMTVTIRAVERDVVTAGTVTGRSQYVARTARGIFTAEFAEANGVYRHDYQPAALAKLWPLAAGRTVTLTGKLLAANGADFKPTSGFLPIGDYEARFAVREKAVVVTAAGPFEIFIIARDIQRRDAQGKPLQRETGEIWFAPAIGWLVRSEMRTDGPKGTTSRVELLDVAGN